MQDIVIPDEMIQTIADCEADGFRKISNWDPLVGAKFLTSAYKNILNQLERFYGTKNLRRSKVLEIGCGNGFFLCYALKAGLNIVGIEPGRSFGFQGRYSRAIKLLELNGIKQPETVLLDASAETLPFAEDTFDVVFGVAVLEHVQNLDLVMKEAIRVLKPHGMLWANLPNFNSIHEWHYDIFWIPHMRKNIAKLYVQKLFGRDPRLIDELNFTTPAMFKKYLNSPKTQGKIYLHSVEIFSPIFEAYKYCLDNFLLPNPKQYRGFKKIAILLLRKKLITLLLRLPLYILVKVLEIAGLATTFDMILYKKINKSYEFANFLFV